MSCDRIVRFSRNGPSQDEIKLVIADYLGAFASDIYWDAGRWNVPLVGSKRWPFRRVYDKTNEQARVTAGARKEEETEERWLEVFLHDDAINVITRHADEATSALADDLARLIALYWRGELEQP